MILSPKVLIPALISLWLPVGAEEISSGDRQFFEEKIRPIFEENCLRCHSEAEKKRKGGLLLDRKVGWMLGGDSGESVLNLENPAESLLLKMVNHDPDYEAMPPKKKLGAAEIELLQEWVTRGAPDPRLEALGEVVEQNAFDLDERRKWWSLQPLTEVPVPKVQDESWPRTDVDRFLLAKLEEKGWQPAGSVDRATLLRRASFTLTGLAPTVAEVEGFLADSQPDAYERQVDRLMASPHFGERFARHWMDVVRYADTKAFEQDYTIPYGNEYRDYLIRAFNDDVPFDQFVREAFAGDLLESPRIRDGVNESVIGPGFFLFTDGQHGPPDLHLDEARVFNDMINTASVAFQGLTVACAKCHDHKFDAITTADYYSMYGMLRSSRLDYASKTALDEVHRKALVDLSDQKGALAKATLGAAKVTADVVQRAMDLLKTPEVGKILPEARRHRKPEQLAQLKAFAGDPLVGDWLLFLGLEQPLPELNGLRQALIQSGPGSGGPAFVNPDRFRWRMDGEGFVKVKSPIWILDANDPGLFRAGVSNGWVTGHQSARVDGKLRTEDFVLDGEPVELWVRGRSALVNLIVRNYELVGYGPTTGSLRVTLESDSLTRVRFDTRLWEGETAYLEVLNQGPLMKCLNAGELPGEANDQGYVHVPESFDPGSWSQIWADPTPVGVAAKIGELMKSPDQFPELVGALVANGLVTITPDVRILSEIQALENVIPRPRYVRSLTEGHRYNEPVYIRGNHQTPSKEANPMHFLDGFGGSRIVATGSGRLEFAEHLLTTSSALTARVRVNRLWSRVFGRGIVGSVDDFGKMGELPSHPGLLDFMARKFVSEGWSTKRFVRELMVSSAYQMSSVPGAGVSEEDPKNMLLQRMPLHRLDAESVRDHIMQVSGNLKPDLYGDSVPGIMSDLPPGRGMRGNGPIDGEGRRTIYIEVRRNFLSSFLRAFNLPIPSEPVGKRQVTTVPAQSLTLMNSGFVHHQARVWAASLSGSDDERIRQVHLQAFSRPPTEAEIAWARRALTELGDSPWVSLCHLMFNRKEFVYVF